MFFCCDIYRCSSADDRVHLVGNKLEICPPGEPAGDEDGKDYKPPDERVPGKGGWIPTDCETTGNFSRVQKLQLPDSHPYCNCLITKC